jgi:hypothetical protein
MTIKALYPTVRPTLNLDFAKTKALDPRVTFTRASTGTFVGSNGLIQTAASGAARFDHNPATGESLGLLVEEARTNSQTYSNSFSTNWTLNQNGTTTVTPNAAIGPSGQLDATKLSNTAGAYIEGPNFVSGDNLGFGMSATFNLATQVATIAGNSISASIQEAGNGWFRCIYMPNTSGALNRKYAQTIYAKAAESSILTIEHWVEGIRLSVTGGIGAGVYIWGAQVELGTFPTSYIPTVASTVTRAADVATLANTGSILFPTSAFTTVNTPFGTANGGTTVKLVGPTVKRTAIYASDLTQAQINALASVNDEFWRWRVLGSSFALPNFLTDGQVTVDWGDGIIETLTTAEHTFSNGGGYHDIGFRLDSGTYFRPYINGNASHDTKVVALGPAPESMKLNGDRAFNGCSNLEAFDATVDTTGGTNFISAWNGCNSLTSFPLIDTSSGTSFSRAWRDCTSLTSFPLINTAAGNNFTEAWSNCSSLTNFPEINTAAGTNFTNTWEDCSSLTSFPLIDTAAGTSFNLAWDDCNSLTSFPLINTAAGTDFSFAWRNCSSLTSFPLINTGAGTDFNSAWTGCNSLTSFPLIDTAAGTDFNQAWRGCSSLTSFPLINTGAGTEFHRAWQNCSSLTDFPANFFDSWTGTPANSCFVQAWDGCSALTATSVENILNSIDTSGQSAPASGVDITIDYNAGTGTPSVATAITNLQSRGWTITLNGVLQ